MKLLIDIGNTRLKWGLASNGDIITTGALLNNHISFPVLVDVWQGLSSPQSVAISCVNSPQATELISSVAAFLWPGCPAIMAQPATFQCGVRNAYIQPEKLGVDRWLALVAVHNAYHHAACIVDCGTAITVDLIDAQGQHQGGLISPGLTLMRQSLSRGTHQLPLSDQDYAFGLANNTEAGIYNGIIAAACGLIERVVAQHTDAIPLILTGGDARLIRTQLACPAIIDDNLVLRGLIYVLDEHTIGTQDFASLQPT